MTDYRDLQPGDGVLFAGMSWDDYEAIPAVRSSELKLIDRSPFHAWYAYHREDRDQQDADEKEQFKIGRAVHAMILEPHTFAGAYAVLPAEFMGRSKAAIAAREDFAGDNQGKTILTPDQHAAAATLADAGVHALTKALRVLTGIDDMDAGRFLAAGLFEVTIVWRDTETGLLCKCRCDWLMPPNEAMPNGLILDVKTTKDGSPDGFSRECVNYAYPLQATHYGAGVAAAFGRKSAAPFLLLAVEKEEPNPAAVYMIDSRLTEYGRREWRRLMELRAQFQGIAEPWPGYGTGIVTLAAPAWLKLD